MYRDSVDKITESYFSAVTKVPFTYKGRTFEPKTLRVSPLIMRTVTCPPNCGACCSVFSLDYLPSETRPKGTKLRKVILNSKSIYIYTIPQKSNNGHFCKYLQKNNGRCIVHGKHPFSCDFELIRTSMFSSPKSPNQVSTRLYGRGWNMLRVDEERGAFCKVENKIDRQDTVRKLKRLQEWADHFKLQTKLPAIIDHIENRLFTEPLFI